MKLPRVRISVRGLLVLVAVVALVLAVWAHYFDPVRRWQRAVFDADNGSRRAEAASRTASKKAGVDPATAIATLQSATLDSSWGVRFTAIRGLGTFRAEALPALPSVLAALADPDPWIRSASAEVLPPIVRSDAASRRTAVTRLQGLLVDNSRAVRFAAARALAYLDAGEPGIPALLEALSESDYSDQLSALNAITRIGIPTVSAVIPTLKTLASRPPQSSSEGSETMVSLYAARTLCDLGEGNTGVPILQALTHHPRPTVARVASRELAELLPHP